MPSSDFRQISSIMGLIIDLNPKSILDIGVGFGKYGVLCREYLELWDGRYEYNKFMRKIDGVEAFEEYITPLHMAVYDKIYSGDILKLIDGLDQNYDLVLLIDVLEHFTKPEGEKLVQKILKNNGGLLISTPKFVSKQMDCFNNPFEVHKSQWFRKELSSMGKAFFIKDKKSYIVYLSGLAEIRKIRWLRFKRNPIVSKTIESIYRPIKNVLPDS